MYACIHMYSIYIYLSLLLFKKNFPKFCCICFIHLNINVFIYLYDYLFNHLFNYSFIHLFIYSFIYLFIIFFLFSSLCESY
uniref:Uncharacterized protein n=1 Tax=Glossina morsitans morsitans TaxID=37546 RepID=A0A1B0G9T4_GLOMM